jgi:hypothetical protein
VTFIEATRKASGAKVSLTEAGWCAKCRGSNDTWDNSRDDECEDKEDVSGLVDGR